MTDGIIGDQKASCDHNWNDDLITVAVHFFLGVKETKGDVFIARLSDFKVIGPTKDFVYSKDIIFDALESDVHHMIFSSVFSYTVRCRSSRWAFS